jgi:HTH-type transcriptional regulator/antitoxin HigA
MKITGIKSEANYRRVMKEIDSLMDAKRGTAAGDRLDVLVDLAIAWEEKHHAIDDLTQLGRSKSVVPPGRRRL